MKTSGVNIYGVPYIEFENRKTWLKGRTNGIGASEVSAAIGTKDAFLSQQDLYNKKISKNIEEIIDNERINYGSNAEQYLRGLFSLQFASKYRVEYHAFRIYHSQENPFLTCTLDGELYESGTNDFGIWECKTTWVNSAIDRKHWENRIPDKYYVQVLSQMYITQAKFAILTAQLIYPSGDSEIRHYEIKRESVEDDIEFVVEGCKKFWKYVETKQEPPIILNI